MKPGLILLTLHGFQQIKWCLVQRLVHMYIKIIATTDTNLADQNMSQLFLYLTLKESPGIVNALISSIITVRSRNLIPLWTIIYTIDLGGMGEQKDSRKCLRGFKSSRCHYPTPHPATHIHTLISVLPMSNDALFVKLWQNSDKK